MVDSGSDVVTLREDVLDSLDLELIGPIKSQGVHASKTKNLYRANMIVGNQLLEIEVSIQQAHEVSFQLYSKHQIYMNFIILFRKSACFSEKKTSRISH